MRWTMLPTVLMTCGVALLAARGLPADAPEAATPSVIAVVDGEVVLESMDQRVKLEEEIGAEFNARNAELNVAEQGIKTLVAEMEMLRKGTPEYNTKSRQLHLKQADLEFTRQLILSELEEKRMVSIRRLLDEIHKAARNYSEANGIDLVLQKRFRLEANGPAWNSVLYARAPLDITQEIVKVVNKQ